MLKLLILSSLRPTAYICTSIIYGNVVQQCQNDGQMEYCYFFSEFYNNSRQASARYQSDGWGKFNTAIMDAHNWIIKMNVPDICTVFRSSIQYGPVQGCINLNSYWIRKYVSTIITMIIYDIFLVYYCDLSHVFV